MAALHFAVSSMRLNTAKRSDVYPHRTSDTAPTSPLQPKVAEQTIYPHPTFYFLLAVVERPCPTNFSTFSQCSKPVNTWDLNSCPPVQQFGALTKWLASRMRLDSLHFPDRHFFSSHFPQGLTLYTILGTVCQLAVNAMTQIYSQWRRFRRKY